MSIQVQSETEALARIEELCAGSLQSYDIEPMERQQDREWRYTVTYAIIVKDGTFTPSFVRSAFEMCAQSDGLFRFAGTRRDINDLSFEVMAIDAEITP